jgi:hypothetical protein
MSQGRKESRLASVAIWVAAFIASVFNLLSMISKDGPLSLIILFGLISLVSFVVMKHEILNYINHDH